MDYYTIIFGASCYARINFCLQTQANTKLIKAFRTRGFCRVRIVCTL